MDGMMMASSGMPMMMMAMYFVSGKDLTNFLFKGWNSNGEISGLLGMCAAVLFATVLLEALRTLMTFLSTKNSQILSKLQRTQPSKESCHTKVIEDEDDLRLKPRLMTHAALSFLHVLSTALAYFLMLAVMTFNVWIGVSVIIGTILGYFFFGAIRDHIIFSQSTEFPWLQDRISLDKRQEVLTRSNGAYSSSHSEVHM